MPVTLTLRLAVARHLHCLLGSCHATPDAVTATDISIDAAYATKLTPLLDDFRFSLRLAFLHRHVFRRV